MTNILRFTTLLLTIVAMSSFNAPTSPLSVDKPYGSYNGGGPADNPIIQLTINEDNTFSYHDRSASNNQIEVSGTWETKGNYIHLTENGETVSFHRKWKVDPDCNCVKGRKGLSFYRLCGE